MQARDFKLNVQTQSILLVVLSSLWIAQRSSLSLPPVSANGGPLYSLLSYLMESNAVVNQLFTLLVPMLSGILLNELYKLYRVIPRRSFIILIIWMALISSFPGMWQFCPQMLSIPLIIWGLFGLFRMVNDEPKIRDLISVAFVFSLASLIFFPLIWILIFLPLGIAVLRNFNFRFFMVITISFIVPYLYLAAYYFFIDKPELILDLWNVIIPSIGFSLNSLLHAVDLLPVVYLTILLIISMFSVLNNYNSQLIQIRRLISLTILFLIFVILLTLLYFGDFKQDINFIALPVSVLIALGVVEIKDRRFFWGLIVGFALVPIIMRFL